MDSLVLPYILLFADLALWRMAGPEKKLLRVVVRSLMFVAVTGAMFQAGLVPLHPSPASDGVYRYLASQVFQFTWWMYAARVATVVLDTIFAPKSWHSERLFQDLIGAGIFLAAIVSAMAYVLDLPVRGLLATSGAMAIILGLAVQSTLSDVFSGLVINTTQPYQVGDQIVIDGIEGRVIEMNWRATHILSVHGNVIVIPNNLAAKTKIENISRPARLHGISATLHVTPEVRPSLVIKSLRQAIEGSTTILSSPTPFVAVKATHPDSIEYEITASVDHVDKRGDATNELYDLAHRHLGSSKIIIRPLNLAWLPPSDSDARVQLLSQVEIFAPLNSEQTRQLAQKMTEQAVEPHHVVVARDEIMDYLLIVKKGVLAVFLPQLGKLAEVARLGPGDPFGESGVLAGVPMSATIKAITPAILFRLEKADLTPLLQARPEVGAEMCRLLSRRQSVDLALGEPVESIPRSESGLLHWLTEGMRRLHSLTL